MKGFSGNSMGLKYSADLGRGRVIPGQARGYLRGRASMHDE